jgi:endonuclease YncB( thermonuclease family)
MRLRRGAWAALAAALLSAGLAYYRGHLPPPAAPSNPSYQVVEDLFLIKRLGGVFASDVSRLPRAEVLRAVDGDTLKISWNGKTESLRYFGVNTPESGRPCYDGATERNRALAGKAVFLAFDERHRDKYGRLLAYAFTESGLSIDAQLAAEGWGRAWRRSGRFRDQILDLENEAKSRREGCLWEKAAAGRDKPSSRGKKKGRA